MPSRRGRQLEGLTFEVEIPDYASLLGILAFSHLPSTEIRRSETVHLSTAVPGIWSTE